MIITGKRDTVYGQRCTELAEATKQNNLKVEERNKEKREGEKRKVAVSGRDKKGLVKKGAN